VAEGEQRAPGAAVANGEAAEDAETPPARLRRAMAVGTSMPITLRRARGPSGASGSSEPVQVALATRLGHEPREARELLGCEEDVDVGVEQADQRGGRELCEQPGQRVDRVAAAHARRLGSTTGLRGPRSSVSIVTGADSSPTVRRAPSASR
jgi:hypothetical protein